MYQEPQATCMGSMYTNMLPI